MCHNLFNFITGSNFTCRIPPGLDKPKDMCKVVCNLEKLYSSQGILPQSQCDQSLNDPTMTFWTYLTVGQHFELKTKKKMAV